MPPRTPTIQQRRRIANARGTYHNNGDGSYFCRLCWSTVIPETVSPSNPRPFARHERLNSWNHDKEIH